MVTRKLKSYVDMNLLLFDTKSVRLYEGSRVHGKGEKLGHTGEDPK